MEMSPNNSTDPNDSDASALLANPSRRLACGALVDNLLEQAADGHATNLTEHQRTCGHCKPALAAFTSLWAPVMQAAANPAPMPSTSVAAISAGVLAGIASPTPASAGGTAASIPKPLNFWRWLIVSTVVIAVAITALFLTRHLLHTTNSPTIQPSANPTATNHATTAPNSARPAPPTSTSPTQVPTKPLPKKSVSLPTGVPAGNGGQAAATSSTIRHDQLLMLAIGIAITAAGGANVRRTRRTRRSRRRRRASRR